jgi:hypothetical protein
VAKGQANVGLYPLSGIQSANDITVWGRRRLAASFELTDPALGHKQTLCDTGTMSAFCRANYFLSI